MRPEIACKRIVVTSPEEIQFDDPHMIYHSLVECGENRFKVMVVKVPDAYREPLTFQVFRDGKVTFHIGELTPFSRAEVIENIRSAKVWETNRTSKGAIIPIENTIIGRNDASPRVMVSGLVVTAIDSGYEAMWDSAGNLIVDNPIYFRD